MPEKEFVYIALKFFFWSLYIDILQHWKQGFGDGPLTPASMGMISLLVAVILLKGMMDVKEERDGGWGEGARGREAGKKASPDYLV